VSQKLRLSRKSKCSYEFIKKVRVQGAAPLNGRQISVTEWNQTVTGRGEVITWGDSIGFRFQGNLNTTDDTSGIHPNRLINVGTVMSPNTFFSAVHNSELYPVDIRNLITRGSIQTCAISISLHSRKLPMSACLCEFVAHRLTRQRYTSELAPHSLPQRAVQTPLRHRLVHVDQKR
jgi:hypothetical protein